MAASAAALLEKTAAAGSDTAELVVERILKGYLRPLFSASRPPTITASGRKAAFAEHGGGAARGFGLEDRQSKPWKFHDLRAVSVFTWALCASDVSVSPSLLLPG